MIGLIKPGAVVGQDMAYFDFYSFYGTSHLRTKFEFTRMSGDQWRGRAHGFGLLGVPGGYGNGAVFVKADDIEPFPFIDHGDGI